MAKGEGIFWLASVEKAARQIVKAIKSRKPVAYVTRRWRIMATLLKILPGQIHQKM
jgi:short-subunit dehydrogenase